MTRTLKPTLFLALVLLLLTALAVGLGRVSAQESSAFHPLFPLLDSDGAQVQRSGNPVSTMQTCGSCHDTAFIAEHSTHADAEALAGETIFYLDNLSPNAYRWAESGGTEMNCFLCHTDQPDNAARIAALEAGDGAWANSATLQGSGLLTQVDGQWQWDASAFDADGNLLQSRLTVQDPESENCGLCHGIADADAETPLSLDTLSTGEWNTLTTGQVFSPQQMSQSGLNLDGKDELTRSFDIHAERLVGCTDCHYSLNNPVYAEKDAEAQPEHLQFDPRRLEIGAYLEQPLHQLAFESEDGRSCESCHDTAATHEWLPYQERHISALACESCHAPEMNAPALQAVDWTVLNTDSTPALEYRGMDAEQPELIAGFNPVLLPDEEAQLAPYNLVSAWYWVYGDPAQPVALEDLQAAWLSGDSYAPDVLAAFDTDGDGTLSASELVIDSAAKEALIAARLEARGLDNPRITGEVEAYSIHHGMTNGDWATRDCQTCHTEDSRLAQPIVLSNRTPGGVQPALPGGIESAGMMTSGDGGLLLFQPEPGNADRYILGHDSSSVIDLIGALAFVGTFAGVLVHGGLRYFSMRGRTPHEPELKRVYMYSVYERQWHWLQTAAIFLLIFTGLIIHKPDMFGLFSFSYVVQVHNILAIILVINAALSLFYHLVSGEIRQFLPRPYGFFDQMFVQTKYYLWGIFRGKEHPFAKDPQRKMNPIQQLTYLAILNILLPAQIITGILMWGAERWPDVAASLGGLPFLAPLHSLVAWLFATFIVLHVYMTTTGHQPLTNIKAMISGWDEVETGPAHQEEAYS